MRLLRPLPLTGEEVRALCLPGTRDQQFIARLEAHAEDIANEERYFRLLATGGHHRVFTSLAFDASLKRDMMWLYDNRLVDSVAGRRVYDQIFSLGGDECPLCHISTVMTLDHSFPKSQHPRLALEPSNLVPTCDTCNLGRNAGSGRLTVSPYFDNWVNASEWLHAEVDDLNNPGVLRFAARRPDGMPQERFRAIQQFMQDSSLATRYAHQAATEFIPLAVDMVKLDFIDDNQLISDVLQDRKDTYEIAFGRNRWQSAAYQAWIDAGPDMDWNAAFASVIPGV
jgi:hypothetical protein